MLGQFQRLGIADQHAGTSTKAGADHDGRGRGKAEGAGAGNDQHGDGIHQRFGKQAAVQPPAHEGEQRQGTDGGHEDIGHLVRQALHRRLGALGRFHQTHDAGEQGLRPDAGGAAAQQAIAVHRGGIDRIARMLGHGQAFAGEHGLVEMGNAFNDNAIHRHPITGSHDEDVAGNQQAHGHFDHLSVALHPRRLRLQADQRFHRRRRARLGAGFEQLAQQYQGNDGGRGLEIHVLMLQPQPPHSGAVKPGHAGAEGHQHVHSAAAAAQGVIGAGEEAPTDPELHRRRQHKLQPARQQVAMDHALATEHEGHLRQQRQGEHGGDGEVAPFLPIQRRLGGLFSFPRVGRRQGGVVAPRGFDGGHQLLRRHPLRRIAHMGFFGRKIDHRLGAGHLVQQLLDPRGAVGAGEAEEGQFDSSEGCLGGRMGHDGLRKNVVEAI